ncbi:hypothetical protein BSKO_10651 [Bryopsis sp. KO-2023]|nr:hypothetical protein BSKO_10651 [Bryopsis sp. KO-2023]
MANKRSIVLFTTAAILTAFLVAQQVLVLRPGETATVAETLDIQDPDSISLERVCGSPAVDAYAHVDYQCLLDSPTGVKYVEFYNASLAAGKEVPEWGTVYLENADIDGIAVGWGIGNTKATGRECEQACLEHKPLEGGPLQALPCNTWTWCPFDVCWEPDAHSHSKGDCWLKFTEAPQNPEFNMKGQVSEAMRERHPEAPETVQWTAGVLLVPGLPMTNGSWGPRADW